MRTAWLFSFIFVLGACTNAVPTVTYIGTAPATTSTPTSGVNPFVDANTVGTARLSTSDSYSGAIQVHGGGNLRTLRTSDQYGMTVRGVSY